MVLCNSNAEVIKFLAFAHEHSFSLLPLLVGIPTLVIINVLNLVVHDLLGSPISGHDGHEGVPEL
jgi:hypothetical protein